MKRVVLLLLLALCISMVAVAQDSTSTENPTENACYDGGALAGKCDWPTDEENEWAWNCGWYYAAFTSGRTPSAPDWCASLFAKAGATPEDDAPLFQLCIALLPARAMATTYILIEGKPNVPGNATLYAALLGREIPEPCNVFDALPIPVIWMQGAEYVGMETALEFCTEADPSTSWSLAYELEHPLLENYNWYCFSI